MEELNEPNELNYDCSRKWKDQVHPVLIDLRQLIKKIHGRPQTDDI